VSLAEQRDLLALVLDALIPAGDGFPSGGVIALDHVLMVALASTEIDTLFSQGLRGIAAAVAATAAGDFTQLSLDDRESVLRQVEHAHADFFEMLVRHTYAGYYSHPTVVTRLGLTPGPVHPRGHRIPSAELPDLTRVTSRGPLYRPA
jgi:hypothetical protein